MAKLPKYYKIHTDGCTVELEPIYDDLVPVVRCRNCKSYKDTGVFYRNMVCENEDGLKYPDDDCFCSYGELKEGEG